MAEKTEELNLKKAELDKINKKIQELTDSYNSAITEKEQLERDIQDC